MSFENARAATADIASIKQQIAQSRAKIYAAEKEYINARANLERVQTEQMKNIDNLLELAGNVMINLGAGLDNLPKARGFA